MGRIEINPLSALPEIRDALSDILIETVADGGSVHFMHPVARRDADAFWNGALASAARDERTVLGAWEDGTLVGTVTLILESAPNQRHKAEIAKLMTRPGHRGRGVAGALMRVAERLAVERFRTLLVFDTATEGGAGGLYEALGFTLAGVIPDFALKPHAG